MNSGEEILERIHQRMALLGLTANAAGEMAGSRDIVRSIRRGLERGKQQGVTSETIGKLAPVLKTTPQWLLTGEGNADQEPEPAAEDIPATPRETYTPPRSDEFRVADGIRVPSPMSMPKDVPVHGTAMGSVFQNVEGFQFEGGPIDYVRRPPALLNIKDLYALYIVNDSMYPMHPPGEIRFVNPHKPPHIGGTVIVHTQAHSDDPGQAYIKILRKRTTTSIILEQFNPKMTIEIPTKFVRYVHHVYTMNEMFGV